MARNHASRRPENEIQNEIQNEDGAEVQDEVESEVHWEIDRLGPWFHNLHLPGGAQTRPDHPLGDFPSYKWRQIAPHLPADLTGWTALDIGCNAAFYSLELARRGARVTAMDVNDHYINQARWAVTQHGLERRVRVLKRSVYELTRERARFDIVLFMGVFYHLRYPLLALDAVARLQPKLFVFQSVLMDPKDTSEPPDTDVDLQGRHRLTATDWPRMAFIEQTFCQDPTNWWIPNHAAVLAMLRSAGFTVTAKPAEEIFLCRPASHPPPCPWDRTEWQAATGLPAASETADD